LERQIQGFLDTKYPEVKQVTEQIRDHVTKFDIELSNLEEPESTESSSRGKVSIPDSPYVCCKLRPFPGLVLTPPPS
jgi:hypothetical protein